MAEFVQLIKLTIAACVCSYEYEEEWKPVVNACIPREFELPQGMCVCRRPPPRFGAPFSNSEVQLSSHYTNDAQSHQSNTAKQQLLPDQVEFLRNYEFPQIIASCC